MLNSEDKESTKIASTIYVCQQICCYCHTILKDTICSFNPSFEALQNIPNSKLTGLKKKQLPSGESKIKEKHQSKILCIFFLSRRCYYSRRAKPIL